MGFVHDIVAKVRGTARPSQNRIDPAADVDDPAPLAEDRPPTLAAEIRPAAGEHGQGTVGSQADPPR